jgi:hypothetical protein
LQAAQQALRKDDKSFVDAQKTLETDDTVLQADVTNVEGLESREPYDFFPS